jgi:hypothetical protein
MFSFFPSFSPLPSSPNSPSLPTPPIRPSPETELEREEDSEGSSFLTKRQQAYHPSKPTTTSAKTKSTPT